MTNDRELLRRALDALVHHTEQTRPIARTQEAIAAIQAALAEPQGLGWWVPVIQRGDLYPPRIDALFAYPTEVEALRHPVADWDRVIDAVKIG